MSEPDYKAFAIAVMGDWPDFADLDGLDIQHMAERHGLLVPSQKIVPCGNNCGCIDYVPRGEEVDCYVKQYPQNIAEGDSE